MSRYILKHEGWACGSSTACNLVAAVREAKGRGGDAVIVTIKCSRGERESERLGSKEFVERRGLAWEGEEAWLTELCSDDD